MKLSRLLVLSLGLTAGFACADGVDYSSYSGTVWADGVTVDGGWYDANKTDNDESYIEVEYEDGTSENVGADDNMCYAASSSNVIAWWQDRNPHLTTPSTPDYATIWKTYVDNNKEYNEGGVTSACINWWFSGVYLPESDEDWNRFYCDADDMDVEEVKKNLETTTGHYYDQCNLNKSDLSALIMDVWESPDLEEAAMAEDEAEMGVYQLTLDFAKLFDEGCMISLGIASDDENNEIAHAITLWGVEYKDGVLTKLWLTDSDDYELTMNPLTGEGTPTIFSADVTVDEEKNKIYITGTSHDGEGECFYGDGVYIADVNALNASASANWQLVPEPTTATLSLLALAALATRRRRK